MKKNKIPFWVRVIINQLIGWILIFAILFLFFFGVYFIVKGAYEGNPQKAREFVENTEGLILH
jgi:hypothetical protein